MRGRRRLLDGDGVLVDVPVAAVRVDTRTTIRAGSVAIHPVTTGNTSDSSLHGIDVLVLVVIGHELPLTFRHAMPDTTAVILEGLDVVMPLVDVLELGVFPDVLVLQLLVDDVVEVVIDALVFVLGPLAAVAQVRETELLEVFDCDVCLLFACHLVHVELVAREVREDILVDAHGSSVLAKRCVELRAQLLHLQGCLV